MELFSISHYFCRKFSCHTSWSATKLLCIMYLYSNNLPLTEIKHLSEFHWQFWIFLDAIAKAKKTNSQIYSTESQASFTDKEFFSFGNGIWFTPIKPNLT